MKFLKNRFVIGTLCIIAALLIAFFAIPTLQNNTQGAYVSAVRMKQTAEAGTRLTAEMLETMSVPETLVEGGISDISSVVGQYAAADLYTGDYLTTTKLSSTLAEQNSFPAGTAKGKLVVSVTLPSLASGVSGRLPARRCRNGHGGTSPYDRNDGLGTRRYDGRNYLQHGGVHRHLSRVAVRRGLHGHNQRRCERQS